MLIQANTTLIVHKICFDPSLFERNHWKFDESGQIQHRFQIFCSYYVTQLRFHPSLIRKIELDGFIAMLHDELFFSKMWTVLDALRRDAYEFRCTRL